MTEAGFSALWSDLTLGIARKTKTLRKIILHELHLVPPVSFHE